MEQDRAQRIEANRKKLEELKVQAAAQELVGSKSSKSGEGASKPKPRKSKKEPGATATPARKSQREKNTNVTYKEDDYFKELNELRLGGGGGGPRGPKRTVDEEELENLRRTCGVDADQDAVAAAEGAPAKKKKGRGNVDSGKGVRIQGGRVYDSKYGLTCHWCRQKTLEEHVTCSNPQCAVGRLPTTFCKMCLRNRHGEDYTTAAASGSWQCPKCRGTCGKGCVNCCNCGPCRKKLGLEPTGQVIKLAKGAGFTNVHDYLVHIVTGETAEEITARKLGFPWGSWLGEDQGAAAAQQRQTAANKEVQDAERLAEEALAATQLHDTEVPAAAAEAGATEDEPAGNKKAKRAPKRKATAEAEAAVDEGAPKAKKKKRASGSEAQPAPEGLQAAVQAEQATEPEAKPAKVTKRKGKSKQDAAAAATEATAATTAGADKDIAAAVVVAADEPTCIVQVDEGQAAPAAKKRKGAKAGKAGADSSKGAAKATEQTAQEQAPAVLSPVDVNVLAAGADKPAASKGKEAGKAAGKKRGRKEKGGDGQGKGQEEQGEEEEDENAPVPAAKRFAQRRQLAASMAKQAAREGLLTSAETGSTEMQAEGAQQAAGACAAAGATVGLMAAPQQDALAGLNLSRKQRKQLELGLVSLDALKAQLAQQQLPVA